MKLIKIISSAILLLYWINLPSVSAGESNGHGPGNGGYVMIKKGKTLLYDFVEAGIDDDFTISTAIPDSCADIVKEVNDGFMNPHANRDGRYQNCARFFAANTSGPRVERLVKHIGIDAWFGILNKFYSMDNIDAMAIYSAIVDVFDWRFEALPLMDLRDVDTPIDYKDYPLYQVAVRKGNIVTINSTLFAQMSVNQKAGLILHEMLYAFLRPIQRTDGSWYQDNWKARSANANLFVRYSYMHSYKTKGEYEFTLFDSKFGTYGQGDSFIGSDVTPGWSAEETPTMRTGAYIKVINASGVTTNRVKFTFMLEDGTAHEICGGSQYTGGVKLEVARTEFTLQGDEVGTNESPAYYVRTDWIEKPLSKWYLGEVKLDSGNIATVSETVTMDACVAQAKALIQSLVDESHKAPDSIPRWYDGH